MNYLRLIVASWVCVSFVATACAADAPDYEKDIAPIFQMYCVACHASEDGEAGLSLETYDGLLKGGDSGAALAPSNLEGSRLLLLIEGKAEPKMPPEDNEAPTEEEIALIRRWVLAGAKGPTGAAPDPTKLITPNVPLRAPARDALGAAAISPDGKLAAIGAYAEVRLISTESRATVRVLRGIRGAVNDVQFSADGKLLVAAAGEPGVFGEAYLFNVADGALRQKWTGHADSLYSAVLSPDGATLATSGYDQDIRLWNVADGAQRAVLKGHNGAVFDLAFHPKGAILASAGADRTVKLWDVAKGARLDTLSQPLKEMYAVAFSPDGQHVVGGGADGRIRVWRLSETAAEGTNPLVVTRYAHDGAVIKLVFSPDGKTLVTSAENRALKLWDANTFVERRLLDQQSDYAPGVAFGPDNRTLLVARMDGTTTFYDANTGGETPPAKPELLAVPLGLERGVKVTARLIGKNLLNPTEIKTNHKLLTAKLAETDKSSADGLSVDLLADAALPVGSYKLSVATAGGVSNEVSVHVDAIPQRLEREPNDVPSSANHVETRTAVWGTINAPGDIDDYTIEAPAGRTLIAYVEAASIGSALNAVLTLIDADGRVVASNNNYDGSLDPLITYDPPEAGRYTLRVHDLSQTGSSNHFYRLSVGDFALVTSAFPPAITENVETRVALTGYNLEADEHVVMKPEKKGEAAVAIDAPRLRAPRPIKVRVVSQAQIVEVEPNNEPSLAQSSPIVAPALIVGRIGAAGDEDLFRFEAKKGESLILETRAARDGSPLDTYIEVLDESGQPVPRVLLQAVKETYVDFRPINSDGPSFRPKHYQEIALNDYVYLNGEVCRAFRLPEGPDSDLLFYNLRGKRRLYFDTSGASHAMEEPVYVVEPHAPGSSLVPNGLPVFTLYHRNDDESTRELGSDSRLTFTAPADGVYLARVVDVRGFGGDAYHYQLAIRKPKPGFKVRLDDQNPKVAAGSGRRLTFSVDRIDGFEGPITIDVTGLPPGFSVSTPLVIEAGHSFARAVLTSAPDAPAPTDANAAISKVTATAEIDGHEVMQDVGSLGRIQLEPKPKAIVSIEPSEMSIAPGESITITLKADRNNHNDQIEFDIDNLPHGVFVDHIGLNGVLIRTGENERQVVLTAVKNTPPSTRRIFATSRQIGNQSSAPMTLHVRAPVDVAQREAGR